MLMLSRSLKVLNRPISKFVRLGFRRESLPESPKVKPRGAANALGLYKNPAVCAAGVTGGIPALGSPTLSAKVPTELTPLPTPALSEKPPNVTVKGVPVEKLVMPDHCQFPRILFAS